MKEKKKSSIGLKLIAVIVPIVLIIIISFFLLARGVVLKISQEQLSAKADALAGEIDTWTNQIFSELRIYQDTIEGGSFKNDEEILRYMETSVEKNEAYSVGLYMGDDAGVYLDGSGWVPGDDWILVERDWYVDGKDNESFSFSEPYYDSMTGDVCVSASVRVDYEPAVRVLATDVYLDYVVEVISDIAGKGDVEAFLVTQNTGTIIAHHDTEMIAKTLDTDGFDSLYANIAGEISKGSTDVIALKGDSGTYYVALNPIENTDWYLATYVTEKQMLSTLHWMELIMFVIAVAAAVLLILCILNITGRVVKPVQNVTGVIGKIAEGDFTQNLNVSGTDEIAVMSKNMQMFISKMRSTITEISNTAEWLNNQSLENEKVSDTLMDSSEAQKNSMELLSRLSGELSNAADEVDCQMDYLSELIKQTHEDGNRARKLMQESVEMSEGGKTDMENISEGMNSINRSIDALSGQIARVGEAMNQIGGMVSIIMDIAEETNLLSLNASIEAARAGESGRGFAVVAEQIGKLATNSSTAADDIARLTEEIGNTVNEVISHMENSVAEVEKSVVTVTDARTTFVNLYGKVDETSKRVEQMISLVGKVDDVAAELEKITQNQHKASNQILDSAMAMNETTETVVANSSIVAENAKTLKQESVELMDKMSVFRV